jgi:NADP-dependent 3-hydroxy acid dehydrogenase YdfG
MERENVMHEIRGKRALVTCASSGFGVEFATLVPELNANLNVGRARGGDGWNTAFQHSRR